MPTSKPETITYEQFEERLDTNNARLHQELAEAEDRVQRLELLLTRKEQFVQRLTQMLTEIEREEDEIAALEKGVHVSSESGRRRSLPYTAP